MIPKKNELEQSSRSQNPSGVFANADGQSRKAVTANLKRQRRTEPLIASQLQQLGSQCDILDGETD